MDGAKRKKVLLDEPGRLLVPRVCKGCKVTGPHDGWIKNQWGEHFCRACAAHGRTVSLAQGLKNHALAVVLALVLAPIALALVLF